MPHADASEHFKPIRAFQTIQMNSNFRLQSIPNIQNSLQQRSTLMMASSGYKFQESLIAVLCWFLLKKFVINCFVKGA
jgi:hypothetical protein